MNLLHMRYAVEVAATGSINKAAEKLFVGQPNLSRAIKELETGLGVVIFDRSAKGMMLTSEGEVFIEYAKSILGQVNAVENIFKSGSMKKKRFSISVPRVSYITEAFARFSQKLSLDDEAEFFYRETNPMRVIKNILQQDYKLGILHYAQMHDQQYRTLLEEKVLHYELIAEYAPVLAMSKHSPLATMDTITVSRLHPFIEIAHGDPYVPSMPFTEVKKQELPETAGRRIFVFEQASQLQLLSQNTACFMWVPPLPQEQLERYQLIQRPCDENKRIYRDLLIYRKDYRLTELDKMFIAELNKAKQENIG